MKNTSKSLWCKPEMIVLVRSNTEETVLNNCKTSPAGGPYGGGTGCENPGGQFCEAIANT